MTRQVEARTLSGVEPYYADDLVTLYHGDCLDTTAWTETAVLVTDPPYGMSFRSSWRKGARMDHVAGDSGTDVRDAALDLWGDSRAALVFGRWSVAAPTGERQRLIWWKGDWPGMGDLRIPWGPAHEDIHVLGTDWDHASIGLKRAGSVIAHSVVRGSPGGRENATGHPTPKPVGLMEELIRRCPAGVIADPFAGSGATLLAARNLGRKVVGVEVEEKFCEVIARRLDQGVLDFGSAQEADR